MIQKFNQKLYRNEVVELSPNPDFINSFTVKNDLITDIKGRFNLIAMERSGGQAKRPNEVEV